MPAVLIALTSTIICLCVALPPPCQNNGDHTATRSLTIIDIDTRNGLDPAGWRKRERECQCQCERAQQPRGQEEKKEHDLDDCDRMHQLSESKSKGGRPSLCDGAQPVCGRCVSRHVQRECRYDLHIKTQKQEMIHKIHQLESSYSYIEQIIRALSSDENGEDIINRLRNGQSYQSVAESLGQSPLGSLSGLGNLSPTSQRNFTMAINDYDKDATRERGMNTGPFSGGEWTTVTTDHTLINHLLTLYFTWVHPVHMLFSRPHFMASFVNRVDIYCTSALVNAICAMACHLFDPSHDEGFEADLNPKDLREQFMKEARRQVQDAPSKKLAIVQTYAVLFLVDLSSGRGANSASYIRLAADCIDQSIESGYSSQAAEMTRWGIYALSVDWAQFTFQVPTLYQIPSSLDLPDYSFNKDISPWQFYRHLRDNSEPEQPSYITYTSSAHAKLLRIIHDTLALFYHGHERTVTAKDLMEQYGRYIAWKEDLPEEIALKDETAHALPHVIAIHVQYQTALIQLFRPLLGFSGLPREAMEHVRSLVLGFAWTGFAMLKTYQEVYTCRYEQPLQAYALLHICDALIRFDPSPPAERTEVVRIGLQILREAADGRGGYSVCPPLQEAFRMAAVECNIPLPEEINELIEFDSIKENPDAIINATTRLSYTQPVFQAVRCMSQTFGDDFAEEWRKFVEGDTSRGISESDDTRDTSDADVMKIDSILSG
ncbi:hypothetical protein MMC18_002303 [Xylographa bjoerkii]|nr:hypothetical protein [Xylographa bjoerkii]